MIYALYIEQKITIFALYTKHKYKNQINNLTMENELQVIGTKEVEERIIELRGQKILLDRDVAELYKTETRDINKAVRNNPEKFPSGYFFKLRELIRNVDAIQNEPDLIKQKGIVKRTGQLLSDLLIDDADTTEMESTIELNLMAVKLKHTVKRIKNNNKTEDKSEI